MSAPRLDGMSNKGSKRMSKEEVAAHLAACGRRIGTCECGGPKMAQSSMVNLYTVCNRCNKTVILGVR